MRKRYTTEISYDVDDIEKLQGDVQIALSKVINRANSSRKFDLGIPVNKEVYLKLSEYNNILERVKYCDDCFGDFKAGDIISVIKTNITKL